jgi:acyl-CoA thioesterase-1
VDACLRHDAKVLLVGMRLPPNYGASYVRRFESTYREIAKKYDLALVPFLLEGFAERQQLVQADGIHPTREAQPLMLETVWRVLQPMLNVPRPVASPR